MIDPDSAIVAMTDRIVEKFSPVRIILFGSYARGEADTHSDIDLLVVLPTVADKRQSAIEIRRTLADFPLAKDILVTSPAEIYRRGNVSGTALRSALREGKILYERPRSSG